MYTSLVKQNSTGLNKIWVTTCQDLTRLNNSGYNPNWVAIPGNQPEITQTRLKSTTLVIV
jgi:hypothetical protein